MNERLAFPFEVKDLAESGSVAGWASVYDLQDRQGDTVAPGALAPAAERVRRTGQPLPMLRAHDPARVVGAWHTLRDSARGLYVEGQIAIDTTEGREAHSLLKMRALGGLSIGATAVQRETRGGRRHIVGCDLLEISLTAIPANAEALVTTVKAAPSHAELSEILKAHGFGGRAAKRAAAAAIEAAKGHHSEDDELAELRAAIEQGRAMLARYVKGY